MNTCFAIRDIGVSRLRMRSIDVRLNRQESIGYALAAFALLAFQNVIASGSLYLMVSLAILSNAQIWDGRYTLVERKREQTPAVNRPLVLHTAVEADTGRLVNAGWRMNGFAHLS